MKKSFAFVLALALIAFPAIVAAQNFTYVNNWLNQGIYWLRLAITVIMILMTVFFLFNVFKYIQNKDATKSADLKNAMLRGMVGLFVAVAVWGIIKIGASILGINNIDQAGQAPINVTCPPGLRYSSATGTCER